MSLAAFSDIPPEKWRKVRRYPYEVSNYGRVRNLRTGRFLKPYINDVRSSDTYLRVQLSRPDRRRHYYLHRLVAIYHVPGRSASNVEVHHIDGNSLNNRFWNLRWVSKSQHLLLHTEDATPSPEAPF